MKDDYQEGNTSGRNEMHGDYYGDSEPRMPEKPKSRKNSKDDPAKLSNKIYEHIQEQAREASMLLDLCESETQCTIEELLIEIKEAENDYDKYVFLNNRIGFHFNLNEPAYLTLLNYSAKYGNIYSMKQLADICKEDEYAEESERQLYWLEMIYADPAVRRFIDEETLPESISKSAENLQLLAASVCFQLAMYYRKSDDVSEMERAKYFFEKAKKFNCRLYTVNVNIDDLMNQLSDRIIAYGNQKAQQSLYSNISKLFKNVNISKQSTENQIKTIRNNMKNEIGLETWNKFQKETRSCLVTAAFCLNNMEKAGGEIKNLDFSSAIVPLMKTLEHEVRIRFYDGYIKYLKIHYKDINRFMDENRIYSYDKNKLIRSRGGILYYGGGDPEFSDPDIGYKNYTLGNFIYSTGLLDLNRECKSRGKSADTSMIEYCRNRLFRDNSKDDTVIDKQLFDLASAIDKLRKTRNESAHGGNVKGINDAEKALNMLLLSEKILVDMVTVCK